MRDWFRNLGLAVYTVAQGLWVTLRYWLITYDKDRGTFTQKFEYPEKPVPVAPRYRGFHRYDLTTCISCDQCAKACPVDCIYEADEQVYIHPDECIDCGNCADLCAQSAIFAMDDLPADKAHFAEKNAAYFQ